LIAALTLIAIVFELILVAEPRFADTAVDGVFFNTILLGYGLPAVLAITLALIARTTRPMPYRVVAAITAVTLALFYLTLQTRRLFHGPILAGATSEAVTGIVVDLSEVTFLDAAGLGALAGGAHRARHLPGGLRLVAVPPRVLRLLNITGLDRHLAAFPPPAPAAPPEPVTVGAARTWPTV